MNVKYSIPQITAHTRKIIDEVWKIRKSKKEDMKPNRNDFCNWCAYKTCCPEFNSPQACSKKIEELKASKPSGKSRK